MLWQSNHLQVFRVIIFPPSYQHSALYNEVRNIIRIFGAYFILSIYAFSEYRNRLLSMVSQDALERHYPICVVNTQTCPKSIIRSIDFKFSIMVYLFYLLCLSDIRWSGLLQKDRHTWDGCWLWRRDTPSSPWVLTFNSNSPKAKFPFPYRKHLGIYHLFS